MRRLVAACALALALAGCGVTPTAGRPVAQASVPAPPSFSGPPASAPPPSSQFPIPEFPPAPVPETIALPANATPFLHRIPTTQKVAFLTIDDGYTRTAVAPELIAAAHIPVTMFLVENAVTEDPAYFRPMLASGAVIGDHTVTHPELRGRSYAFQRHQICDSADYLARTYGTRPSLFRPPFGDADATTLRAAHDCGMRAAFMWTETVDKGIVRYQGPHHSIQPGDIILMHFRPAFPADFLAALNAIHKSGLTPALLSDYVPA